jgi:predicted DNA-binding ribbon-helix-helix protein
MKTVIEENQARRLWSAVLIQAIKDSRNRAKEMKSIRAEALEWIKSNSNYENSFCAICTILDLNPAKTREKILSGDRRAKKFIKNYEKL